MSLKKNLWCLQTRLKQRNIKKKWATYDNNGNIDEYLDPRANDGLTKVKSDILANMHSANIVAMVKTMF